GTALLVDCNRCFWQTLSKSQAKVVNTSLSEHMPTASFTALLTLMGTAAKASGPLTLNQLQFFTASGETVTCQSRLSKLDANGRRFLLSIDDISTYATAEKKRLDDAAYEQREDFMATLAHDLKTPVVGANMVLTALLDGTLGSLKGEQAQIIEKLRGSNQ